MVSSDSAAWALHAPSRRRTAGSRRGSAGRRSASGAGMRRARSRTGAGPAPVPASSAAARSSGARAWCRAARAARSSPAPGNPSTTVVPASRVSSACPNRRCARPSAGPSPPARSRPPSGPTTRGARGPDPDQSSVPAAPSSTAHCAAPSTGGPGRRETHSSSASSARAGERSPPRASATRRRSFATGTPWCPVSATTMPTRSSPNGITSVHTGRDASSVSGSDRGEGDPAAPGQREPAVRARRWHVAHHTPPEPAAYPGVAQRDDPIHSKERIAVGNGRVWRCDSADRRNAWRILTRPYADLLPA